MTVSEAFARYTLDEITLKGGAAKTTKNYRSVLSSFVRACSDVPVELITYDLIVRWKAIMDSLGLSNATQASYLARMRQVLKYLRKHDYKVLDESLITSPKVIVKESDYLDYSEVQVMLDCAIRPRDRALIACLWSSGGRISEVLSLNRDSIRIENGIGKAVVLGKGSKYITLYFDKKALEYIQDYLQTRKDTYPPLFLSGQCKRIGVQRVEQIIWQIAQETGIEKRITPHVFRHSYATDLLNNGADIREVQMLLHHANISTTSRYLHSNDKQKDDAYLKYHRI